MEANSTNLAGALGNRHKIGYTRSFQTQWIAATEDNLSTGLINTRRFDCFFRFFRFIRDGFVRKMSPKTVTAMDATG